MGGLEQGSRGDDLVDEPQAQGFLGVDHVAGEQQAKRRRGADEPRQALAAAVARDEAELDFGLAEARAFGGQAIRACHGELAAAAQRKAVDACEDRFAAGFHLAHDGLAAQRTALARHRRRMRRAR